MAQYRTCPYCEANLDPDERCECREQEDKECGLPFHVVPESTPEGESNV